jgi:spore coat polysaccharide biosynthesis predicted glycosyltransferase SpsG
MRYILRADSSLKIGSGHVMRSSAIAEELIARGEEVIFVGDTSEIPWLSLRIGGLGFSQVLDSSRELITTPETDILILDSYTLSIDDEFIQKNKWRRIVAIVDESTPAYEADLIIHPSLSENWRTKLDSKFLTGPKYIPFRKSIKKKDDPLEDGEALVILVIGGGTDTFNFVEAICVELKNVESHFQAKIFSSNEQLSQLDSRFTNVPIGSQLDFWATSADLVFTTASTTSLEFIAREIPVGLGCAIDNQEEYYESLTLAGVAMPIGQFRVDKWDLDQPKMEELINSRELREALKQKSAGLVDLKGAERIVDEILKL